jgi:hypothetical protein
MRTLQNERRKKIRLDAQQKTERAEIGLKIWTREKEMLEIEKRTIAERT